MDAVVAASATLRYRPSLARLSAGFPYRDVAPRTRGSVQLLMSDSAYTPLVQLIPRLQHEPSQHHPLGVSYLLVGETATSIETLEQALRIETGERGEIVKAIRRSQDYALLNDLAAAYETRFEQKGDLDVQPLALEAAERAWTGLRTPQIAWTRAVVIDSFHVHERSAAAWRDYQALDSRSQWSEFARHRLQEALQPTDTDLWPSVRKRLLAGDLRGVDRFRQEVRFLCEDELLPQWGEAVLRGHPSAPEQLAKIAALAQALGERSVAGAVDAIRKAKGIALRRLAKGHVAYGEGRRADLNNEADRAMRAMNEAVAALTPELTPFAWRARIEHAGDLYSLNEYEQALAELRQVLDDAPQLTNDSRGRANALMGSIYLQTGSYKESADRYERALDAFRRAGEREQEATLVHRIAVALQLGGEDARARPYRHEAMKLLDRAGTPSHRHEAMLEAAYVAIGNDHQAVADFYLDTIVTNDKATRNAVATCSSLMWRSAYRYHRGLLQAASGDLEEAQRVCRSITDPSVRQRALANLELAHASLGGKASPGLDDAIRYYQKSGIHVWLRTAYFARARQAAGRGDDVAAERDYRAALEETEASRGKIDERQMRISFTATADEIGDGYVEFLLRRHRERDAFETADRIRLRELVDSPTARWTAPPTGAFLPTVQSSLAPGTALVEYRVLDKNVVAWVITANSFNAAVLPISGNDLKPALAALETDIREQELKANAGFLYDALLRRIDSSLPKNSDLIIVPDDDLERVPFSALYDRLHGRFLVETRATTVAPSAALYVQSVARSHERSQYAGRMVVIRAASFGSGLPALPEAAVEAEAVARLYPNAQIIDNSGQAGSVLLNLAKNASFLHFVGHTALGGDGAVRELRVGKTEQARLGAADIVAAALPGLRLVYLSACETDQGPIFKSEGSITIARSFFAAGVPVVIGTLWPVEDAAARRAARTFYEHLQRGNTPAESLRQAQMSLLSHDSQSRVDWAAFRIIGAGARGENR